MAVSKKAVRAGFSKAVKNFKKNSWKHFTRDGLKDAAKSGISENAVKVICNDLGSELYSKVAKTQNAFDPSTFDLTGISTAVEKCTGDVEGVGCAAAVVGAVSLVDPTNLLGLAASLMHKECEKPNAEDPASKFRIFTPGHVVALYGYTNKAFAKVQSQNSCLLASYKRNVAVTNDMT